MNHEITKRGSFAMLMSFSVTVLLLAVKTVAYYYTDSRAVFADMMESLLHLGVVGVTSVSLWYASKPADHEHRYGHGKATYFSAGFEGFLVLLTGGGTLYNIFSTAWSDIFLDHLPLGITLITLVVLINGVLGTYLVRLGEAKKNAGLISHGYHVLTDMGTSFAVLASLFITALTGWHWVDAACGVTIAVWILYTGGKVCFDAFQGLMEHIDENVHSGVLQILHKAEEEKLILDYHQLRHRRINDQLWIEVHLLFDGHQTLEEVHHKATELEMRIVNRFPDDTVHITTHLEPRAHKSAHPETHPDHTKV